MAGTWPQLLPGACTASQWPHSLPQLIDCTAAVLALDWLAIQFTECTLPQGPTRLLRLLFIASGPVSYFSYQVSCLLNQAVSGG